MGTVRYTVIDGEVIAEKRGGVRRQYVPDPLGSTVALLDSAQAKSDTFSYWPYGEESGRTGTTPTSFRYVGTMGYFKDENTGPYVRARYLDPERGRWITEDPLWPEELQYAYVNNNPMRHIDFFGLQANQDTCGACAKAQKGYAKNYSGTVVCCNGNKVICTYLPRGIRKGISDCVQNHEEHHKPMCQCGKADSSGYAVCECRPIPRSTQECSLMSISLDCLLKARDSECTGGTTYFGCRKQYHRYMCQSCMYAAHHCGSSPFGQEKLCKRLKCRVYKWYIGY
jgi:RHS repeat-associated protein